MAKYPSTTELAAWMRGKRFNARRSVYVVKTANAEYVVFESTGSTGQVMLPTELVLEWVTALIDGRVFHGQDPRTMRENVYATGSDWAKQLHSFETHLAAVVDGWKL